MQNYLTYTYPKFSLELVRLGIDTHKESVIYMREDCHVCKAEGFEIQARVKVSLNGKSIIATLQIVKGYLIRAFQAGLSEYAWNLLGAREGDKIYLSHPKPLLSHSLVRSKIYGNELTEPEMEIIMHDIVEGYFSDIYIAAFLTACAGGRMTRKEIEGLTRSMIKVGDCLTWPADIVVDKHSIGGLPGNRTTPIIVAIVSTFGLMMPKTSSRSITSPSGTADTMEVLAPVELDSETIRNVVNMEGGCIVWGGSVDLSPADDVIIRVEKALDIDAEGQLIASVLSKKIAAGSTHVLLEIPVGPTAKVRTQTVANELKDYFVSIGESLGIHVKVIITDGIQPIGNGMGPALEARDILSVLRCDPDAPQDLKERALLLAGYIIEFSPSVIEGDGYALAREILESGRAWKKFQAICAAQGGMREIPLANYTQTYFSEQAGVVVTIDNRRLAKLAKFAGAPHDKVAGIAMHVHLGYRVTIKQPLFTIHTKSPGELAYALGYLQSESNIIEILKES